LTILHEKDCIKKIIHHHDHIDILVNNAGVSEIKPFLEQEAQDIEYQVAINLTGLMILTKEALPFTKDAIINIASGAGYEGVSGLAPYCATKFGVRGFSQALAKEVKIKVIVVNPGTTATRMTNFRGVPPEKVAKVVLHACQGKYNVISGGDVNVWET
jgi:short-subunit dehydrogenase